MGLVMVPGCIALSGKCAAAVVAKPNATEDECKAIARAKLLEATEAVVSSLVKQ